VNTLSINIKNVFRWVKTHIVEWMILGLMYVVLARLVFVQDWWAPIAALVLPFTLILMSKALLDRIGYRIQGFKGIFKWLQFPWAVDSLRRLDFWIILLGSVLAEVLFYSRPEIAFLIFVQLPVQWMLYRLRFWISFTRLFHAKTGAQSLYYWTLGFNLTWAFLISVSFYLVYPEMGFYRPLGMFAAVLGATIVLFEGDSGRPVLVQLVSLTTGTFAGWSVLDFPYMIIFWFYLAYRMGDLIKNRLVSIESMYEDIIF
jgi:hypothetical protein